MFLARHTTYSTCILFLIYIVFVLRIWGQIVFLKYFWNALRKLGTNIKSLWHKKIIVRCSLFCCITHIHSSAFHLRRNKMKIWTGIWDAEFQKIYRQTQWCVYNNKGMKILNYARKKRQVTKSEWYIYSMHRLFIEAALSLCWIYSISR